MFMRLYGYLESRNILYPLHFFFNLRDFYYTSH